MGLSPTLQSNPALEVVEVQPLGLGELVFGFGSVIGVMVGNVPILLLLQAFLQLVSRPLLASHFFLALLK